MEDPKESTENKTEAPTESQAEKPTNPPASTPGPSSDKPKEVPAVKLTSKGQLGRLIAVISAVVLIIAAFLPWGSVLGLAVRGTEGDGVITIGLGIISIVLLLIKKVPVWVPIIFL